MRLPHILPNFFHNTTILRHILSTSTSTKLNPLDPYWSTRAFTYSKFEQLGVTVVSVNVATLLYLILRPSVGGDGEYLFYLAAVIVSSWFGGIRSGLCATLFSLAFGIYINIGMRNAHTLIQMDFIMRSVIFTFEGVIISALIHSMHSSLTRYTMKALELSRSEEKYRQVVGSVTDYAIYTLDIDGYITGWNRGAESITGYTETEVIGKHFSIFYDQDEVSVQKPWIILREAEVNGSYSDEATLQAKSHHTYWASTVVTAIRDANGKLYGYSVISRDMTERVAQERKKDEFISIASHELKTPVTSLKAFTQLLIRLYANAANKSPIKFLHKMDVQLDRLTLLVNDLLDVSRIQSGNVVLRPETLDMNQLVHETIEDLQELSRHHTFRIKGKVLHSVTADKDRIHQVLTNFITNAVKYSPNAQNVDVSLAQDGNQAIIGVKDYGIGIPKDYHDKIFDRFVRINSGDNNFPGLGMGLYISSEIIKKHNGKVWVESEVDKGSTFYFSLPL